MGSGENHLPRGAGRQFVHDDAHRRHLERWPAANPRRPCRGRHESTASAEPVALEIAVSSREMLLGDSRDGCLGLDHAAAASVQLSANDIAHASLVPRCRRA